jgi:hypothetical protein
MTAWEVYQKLVEHFPDTFWDFAQVPVLNEPPMLVTDYNEAE